MVDCHQCWQGELLKPELQEARPQGPQGPQVALTQLQEHRQSGLQVKDGGLGRCPDECPAELALLLALASPWGAAWLRAPAVWREPRPLPGEQ